MFDLMSYKYQVGAKFRAFIIRCILIAQLSAALISVVSSICRNEKVILTRMDTLDSVELPVHFFFIFVFPWHWPSGIGIAASGQYGYRQTNTQNHACFNYLPTAQHIKMLCKCCPKLIKI